MKNNTLKRNYLIIMFVLGTINLMTLFGYYGSVINITTDNAVTNLEFIMGRVSQDLNDYADTLIRSADTISFQNRVYQFLEEDNYGKRYKTDTNVYSLIKSIIENNQYLDSIILYDRDGFDYQYEISIDNKEAKRLYQDHKDDARQNTFFYTMLNGIPYIGVSATVYSASDWNVKKLGMAILLSKDTHIRSEFSVYEGLANLEIIIADQTNNKVLVANNRDYENKDLASLDLINEEHSYQKKSVISNSDFLLVTALDKELLMPYARSFLYMAIIFILLIVAFFFLSVFVTNQTILKPIHLLIQEMKQMGNQTLRERLVGTKSPDINSLVGDINALLDRLEDYSRRVFNTQQQLYEAELKKQEQELYVLRKQINAHFIYNTLNSIRTLAIESGEENIEAMSEGLSSLIRYAYHPEEYINIFKEFQIIEQYIYIMNIRYHNKFAVSYDVDDELCDYKILRQLIQPIIENALTYGGGGVKGQLEVIITGKKEGDLLRILVSDNGAGMPEKTLERQKKRLAESIQDFSPKGISLVNINQRIKLYYGDAYGLEIESKEGEGTIITFIVPLLADGRIQDDKNSQAEENR
ncbi:MAG TPA: histidine kinase [Clostridiales bacterium]|nr:histidine kinase [Clostridiales bacterium]